MNLPQYPHILNAKIFSEVILTLGSSRTVLEFLCAAKEKKRSFRVFVAEGAPRSELIAKASRLLWHRFIFVEVLIKL